MRKNRLTKRLLCISIVLTLLMSFSMGVFADSGIQRSMTVSYSFFGPYGMDLGSVIPQTAYYSSSDFSGYLNLSSYTVTSQVPDLVDYNYYTYYVDAVYSGSLTVPPTIWKTQTYNISLYATPDTLESSIISSMGGYSIGYNDGYYSGSLNYSSYNVTSQTPDLVDYNYYSYNISVVYCGYVNALSSTYKTQTYSVGFYATPDTFLSNLYAAVGGSSVYYNDGYYSGTLNYSSCTVTSQVPDLVDYNYYFYNVNAVYSGTVYH
ncbi:MAG TPA: hypothetical protein VHT96_15995 [Clostridia bacterium]|nr:hypothetical protein [Clostridia bacterium]